MNLKHLLWLTLIPAITAIPLTAQDARDEVPPGAAVFAPFVSRLEGEVRNNLVRLTWTDSPDARGPVYIYRSPSPFATAAYDGSLVIHNIRPVEIPYGTQSYIDEIETTGTIYYFVAASDGTGQKYQIPASSGNIISVQVTENSSIVLFPRPAAEPAAEPRVSPGPAGAASIETYAREDRVTITFGTGTKSPDNITLYRSTRPIRATADLLNAVIVQRKAVSPFTDFPVPGIPYYYAVIAEEDLIRGIVEIIPGQNASQRPAVAGGAGSDSRNRNPPVRSEAEEPLLNIRAMPLPQVSVHTALPGMNTQTEPSAPMELSSQASKALGDIPERPRSEIPLKSPRVFARDMENSPAGGEAYALSRIARGSFFVKKWDAAREELISFLSLPRLPDIKARAQFYLGQCYYFQARPREALFEFLAIQDRYPEEAIEWIQASLDLMRE